MDTSTTQNNQTELIVLSPFTYSLLNIFSTNVAIPHIFAAIVGIPSALLYIFELIILYKHWSKFKSSFFVLFFFRAIISLINLFLSYLNQRFLKFGFFVSVYQQMPTLLLATLYFFIYYPFHVENIISVFLIINRLTSIVFPIKYGKIWTKSRMLAVIIFSCVAPLAFTYHIFQYTVYVKMIYSDNYILAYSDKTHGDAVGLINKLKLLGPFSNNNGMATLSSIIFMGITIILNIMALFFYKQKNYIPKNNPHLSINKLLVERRLTVYVLVTFIGQLIVSIFMITWYTVSSPLKPYFDSETFNLTNFAVQNQSPWVNDISTIVLPAWFMLWANGRLKQAIFRVLFNIKINILHLVGLNTLIKPVAIVDSSQLACFKQKTIYVQKFDVNARRNMISSSQPVDRNHRNQQPRYII
ncbi:hypothetical protein ACQ4LE_003693 [Meloidogyne hapla]